MRLLSVVTDLGPDDVLIVSDGYTIPQNSHPADHALKRLSSWWWGDELRVLTGL